MAIRKKKKDEKPKKSFHETFAEKIIAMLENGTAPWVKPWKPAKYLAAHNPLSGTIYKGINRVMLSLTEYQDPRWMTYRQAQEKGWQVREGEKGIQIVFFSHYVRETEKDEDGRPILDEDGKKVTREVYRHTPIMRSAWVFNAEQVDGCPPFEAPEADWDPCGKVEDVMANCGVPISNTAVDEAFYAPQLDVINMPPKASFKDGIEYYGTALHEIAHSTGHESRFAREMSGRGNIESYAREELRAEIASWMAGLDLGIGHNPHNGAAYVASWIKRLQKDPQEIIRACRDAQRISEALVMMADGPVDWDDLREKAGVKEEKIEAPQEGSAERTWLNVPYQRRFAAKKAGAKWDPEAKRWHAPEGADMEALAEFLPKEESQPSPMGMTA